MQNSVFALMRITAGHLYHTVKAMQFDGAPEEHETSRSDFGNCGCAVLYAATSQGEDILQMPCSRLLRSSLSQENSSTLANVSSACGRQQGVPVPTESLCRRTLLLA